MAQPRDVRKRMWRFRLNDSEILEVSTPPRATEKQVRRRGRWSLMVGTLVAALMVSAVAGAAVWTDQEDYAPGSVVTISGDNSNGAGYLPGETVVVNVSGPNGYAASCEAVADENGAWSCQVTLWDSDLAVGEYTYTATGQTSGVTETGTFTDAIQTQTTVTSSLNPSNVGDSVTFTATVKSASGTPPAFTGTVTQGKVKFGTGTNCAGGFGELQAAMDVDSNGQVTFTTSSLPAGTTTIRACYLGAGSGASALQVSDGTVVQTVNAPADTTPPVIAPNVSGTPGNDGWYVSDVTVSWTVTDPESAISSTSGCDTTTITTDTLGTTLTCTATSAGGTSSESVTIKRDATPPTISASVSPDRPSTGWWNIASGAPTVSFTCSDATSGIAACPDDYTFSEGEDQSYTGTAYDNAGNPASATVSDIDVDLTPPTLSWSNGPQDGDLYYFGFVPAAPSCTASDSLSGPDSCTVSGYGNTVGAYTMTATAYDKAGNSYQETRSYTVLAWTLYGFYQPVDMGNVFNVVKGGSTVPLKFEIFAGSTELTDTAYVKSFKQAKVACDGTAPTDEIEVTTTGGTSLRYDWVAGQFVQNWQTPKLPGQCYRVTLETQDGSSLVAYFKLK
jgi:hypothetical protein